MNNKKKVAIIGNTGLIGKIILTSLKKKKFNIIKYNSKNIKNIKNKNFLEIYCAGLPAEKWKANKSPSKDFKNTSKLISCLKKAYCEKFYLISTIDIHKHKEEYGKNRLLLEKFVKKNFLKYLIFRLPAVFGKGLKKNILFDLLNKNNLDKISSFDSFQWYDLNLLFSDIKIYENKYGLNKIIELYSKSIKNSEIIKLFPSITINHLSRKKIYYNFKPKIGYYKSKKFMINRVKKFIKYYEK